MNIIYLQNELIIEIVSLIDDDYFMILRQVCSLFNILINNNINYILKLKYSWYNDYNIYNEKLINTIDKIKYITPKIEFEFGCYYYFLGPILFCVKRSNQDIFKYDCNKLIKISYSTDELKKIIELIELHDIKRDPSRTIKLIRSKLGDSPHYSIFRIAGNKRLMLAWYEKKSSNYNLIISDFSETGRHDINIDFVLNDIDESNVITMLNPIYYADLSNNQYKNNYLILSKIGYLLTKDVNIYMLDIQRNVLKTINLKEAIEKHNNNITIISIKSIKIIHLSKYKIIMYICYTCGLHNNSRFTVDQIFLTSINGTIISSLILSMEKICMEYPRMIFSSSIKKNADLYLISHLFDNKILYLRYGKNVVNSYTYICIDLSKNKIRILFNIPQKIRGVFSNSILINNRRHDSMKIYEL